MQKSQITMEYPSKIKNKKWSMSYLKEYEKFYFKIINSKLVQSKFKLRLKFEWKILDERKKC